MLRNKESVKTRIQHSRNRQRHKAERISGSASTVRSWDLQELNQGGLAQHWGGHQRSLAGEQRVLKKPGVRQRITVRKLVQESRKDVMEEAQKTQPHRDILSVPSYCSNRMFLRSPLLIRMMQSFSWKRPWCSAFPPLSRRLTNKPRVLKGLKVQIKDPAWN